MRRMWRTVWPLLLAASCSGPEANLASDDPYERYLGLKELASRTDAEAVAEVVRRADDPHYLVVLGALEILAAWGRPEFLQHVAPRLRHPHAEVRRQACATVAALRNPEGIEGLAQALKDAEAAVRRDAAKALAAFGARAEVLSALLEAMGDRDAGVVYMAHTGLVAMTGRRDVPREKEAWARTLR